MLRSPTPGHGNVARPVHPGADEQGIVALAQLGEADAAADLAVEMELDTGVAEQARAALDHGLLQLEVGDAVDQQSADPVVAIVDVDLVALLAQLLGGGEPGRPGADHADRFGALPARLRRLDPAHLEGGVGDVPLDRADGDRFEALLDHAVALAQAVLRADPAADLGHVVGRRSELVGLLETVLRRHPQPVRDVVVQRAVHLAERDPALLATGRLLGRPLRLELVVDLAEVMAPLGDRPLVGHGLRNGDELHHLGGHARGLPGGRRDHAASDLVLGRRARSARRCS